LLLAAAARLGLIAHLLVVKVILYLRLFCVLVALQVRQAELELLLAVVMVVAVQVEMEAAAAALVDILVMEVPLVVMVILLVLTAGRAVMRQGVLAAAVAEAVVVLVLAERPALVTGLDVGMQAALAAVLEYTAEELLPLAALAATLLQNAALLVEEVQVVAVEPKQLLVDHMEAVARLAETLWLTVIKPDKLAALALEALFVLSGVVAALVEHHLSQSLMLAHKF
jgi:hypothetical protein